MKNYKKIGIIKSKGRLINEPNSPYRSPFQRDRDRIIHSTAFRRLKHKTQVFVNTEGDHYRTRITHSIEVAQIARTISRYLNLNDDLTETLSLAHDLGHTPFGHAGEEALNECMNDHGGFDHNLQTLRIVMFIENVIKKHVDKTYAYKVRCFGFWACLGVLDLWTSDVRPRTIEDTSK